MSRIRNPGEEAIFLSSTNNKKLYFFPFLTKRVILKDEEKSEKERGSSVADSH